MQLIGRKREQDRLKATLDADEAWFDMSRK